MKQGKLIGYFIADQESSFYQSNAFTRVLNFVQGHPEIVKMKEKNTRTGLRLIITFEGINTIKKALQSIELFNIKIN